MFLAMMDEHHEQAANLRQRHVHAEVVHATLKVVDGQALARRTRAHPASADHTRNKLLGNEEMNSRFRNLPIEGRFQWSVRGVHGAVHERERSVGHFVSDGSVEPFKIRGFAHAFAPARTRL